MCVERNEYEKYLNSVSHLVGEKELLDYKKRVRDISDININNAIDNNELMGYNTNKSKTFIEKLKEDISHMKEFGKYERNKNDN